MVGIAGVRVQSFQEWMDDEEAKKSRISDSVSGLPEAERQIGRMVWLKNKEGAAINYPDLKKMTEVDMASIDLNKMPYQSASKAGFHEKPLEGFSVVDFSNVLAGPNCGRMLSELGATVFKVGSPKYSRGNIQCHPDFMFGILSIVYYSTT